METDELLYEVRDDGIATITLNRPERMNSFSDDLLLGWERAIRSAAEDDAVRVVVVTGAGRAFCAGADVKQRVEDNASEAAADDTEAMHRNWLRYGVHRVPQALQYLDKPYLAAINGAAVGAGMDMASMADIRIASDRARFGMSYVRVGLVPGDGGAWSLPRIVGLQKALELIWSGDLFGADEALEMGYVARVVPHEELMDEVYAYAAKLASGPPITMQLAKRLIYRGLNQSFPEALEQAQAAMTIARTSDDSKEGPQAFAEKREPRFQGR